MPTYYLEVEKIEAQGRFMCRFLLSWGKNQRLPVVAIAYSESLAASYSEWQSAYLNYYRNVALGNPYAVEFKAVAVFPFNCGLV